METPSQHVTRLIWQACSRHPGGLRAVFAAIREKEGGARSESAFYQDFNPNPTAQGNLKVRDLIEAMSITGDVGALRYMASLFGYTLTALSACEPDAPTVEEEMLQDYPALVEFHRACKTYMDGGVDLSALDAKKDAAISDIRQTFAKALEKARA